ncbi:PREDICTED: protein FAM234A isoform X1 [Nanorana parkeri]|uniref:protein FAM234A isoform X1 n=1 Tax=Nanorana parkeri TaxID=125878 RepID=UPI000854018B|nr:PREDICTED: protein FAM234A isoform X1 [Nanorana parkeri]
MYNKDLDAEDSPLKNNDVKSLENNNASEEKDVHIKKKSKVTRLSRIRTAAFFGSLFLCLTAVFAFSFIIPCPVRPFSRRTWSVQYDNAVGYMFLATEDVNEDNVQDILFLFKADNSSNLNMSCADGDLMSPCFFLSALSGTNGSSIWISPVSDDDNIQLSQCGIHNLGGAGHSGCLIIGNSEVLLAVDSKTGDILWRKPTGIAFNSVVIKPVLKIPDMDEDGIEDLMIFLTNEHELQSAIFSGKSGDRIGQTCKIDNEKPSGLYTHITKSKAEYVLFYSGSTIKGYSVNDLCAKTAGQPSKLSDAKRDPEWQTQMKDFIPIASSESSGKILYLLNVPGSYYNNILVVKSEVSELLDGQKLGPLWSVNTTDILSKPALGYFKKDALSILMEIGIGNNRKKVIIVDSKSGTLQWEIEMNVGTARQNPGVLNTGDHRSTFLFWGEYSTDFNNTMESTENLYMFHPSQANVLMHLNSHAENIIIFGAALFERSRHACYVLITGPQMMENPGNLTVSKRKLKEDISNGIVIGLGTEYIDTEDIRNHFFRMRYSSH